MLRILGFVWEEISDDGLFDGSPGTFRLFHSLELMSVFLQNTSIIILHRVKTIGKIRKVIFVNIKRNIIISIRIEKENATGYSSIKFNPTDKSSSLLKALVPLFHMRQMLPLYILSCSFFVPPASL